MANTTNFNWETPDDTDLVKDGAAAIRTLGSAIDTSLVDLKGGTTGQILSKATNTDMDFTWITNDVGDITEVVASTPLTGGGTSGSVTVGIQDGTTAQKGAVQLEDSTSSTSTTKAATPNAVKSAYDLANGAIAKSLIDAEGDLIVGDAADAVQRLAIGSNAQVLTVDTTVDGKIKWATPAGGGGGLVFIKSVAIGSGVTSVEVTGAFSSTYDNYKIMVSGGVGDGVVTIKLGSTTTNYESVAVYGSVATAGSGNASRETVDTWRISGASSTNFINVNCDLINPNLAKYTLLNGYWTDGGNGGVCVGVQNSTTQFTAFSLTVDGFTLTGGTIRVYGYANS